MLSAISRLSLLSLFALSVAACPARKQPVETPAEPPKAEKPAEPVEPVEEAAKEPIEILVQLTDEICACKDEACFEAVVKKGEKLFPREVSDPLQETHPEKLQELGEKLMACAIAINKKGDPETYAKKAKTAEANQFLKRISDSVRAFHAYPDPLGSQSGPVARRFPESVGPTPPLGTCCKDGGKCAVNEAYWKHPTWQALDFVMHDPHYYSYELKVDGDSYTVVAHGDLDCDGEYSQFTLYGEVVNGEVETAGDIIKVDPLE